MTYRGRSQSGKKGLLWSGLCLVVGAAVAYGTTPFSVRLFAAFPGILGLFLLCLWGAGQCHPSLSKWLRRILWIGFFLAWAVFASLQGVIVHYAKDEIQGNPKLMIVLGAQVRVNGPSVLLTDRLQTAYAYWEQNPDITMVVTGGQGPDEPCTEASAMAEYLVNLGVPEEQIYLEEEAHNTHENLINSFALLAEKGYDVTQDMIVVSNGFHLARVNLLWNRVAGTRENLSCLAAPSSHQPSKLQSYIREAPALVKSWVLDRS